MDGLIKILNAIKIGSSSTKTIHTTRYDITVSLEAENVKIVDKHTHEVFTMKDFSDREITLLAIIAVLEEVI